MSLTYARNSGTLQAMGGSVNLNSIIEAVASGGGVASLQGGTGALLFTSSDESISVARRGQELDITANLQGYATTGAVGAVETIANDAFNLATTAQGQAEGAQATANTALNSISMSWDFEGTGLGHTTRLNLPAPYTFNALGYTKVWTLSATIPENWIARANTFISLFIWNVYTFSGASTATAQYFTYSINGGHELPYGKTSATRPFTNGGLNQLIPITGNLTGIGLAPGDTVDIAVYIKTVSGTATLQNRDESGWGVFSATF